MNKTALRNFSIWSRRYLIEQISTRAEFIGIHKDGRIDPIQSKTSNSFMVNGVTFDFRPEARDAFEKMVKDKNIGWTNAIEEIAYTWFNRILAIRFMEVNGYLENGVNGECIYVIGSTDPNRAEPDAVHNATKLKYVDKDVVYDFQDRDDTAGLFRYILRNQCIELSQWMPDVFEKVSDFTELLMPETLLLKDGIVDRLTHDLEAKDFDISAGSEGQVEIFGWMYQFYISEKKDEVKGSDEKVNKNTLPAATQLFTPDWIVRYMVQNTLGKIWVTSQSSSELKANMKYYLEPDSSDEEVLKIHDEIKKAYRDKSIREIKFIDPCCGSGHVLVYAFDLFYQMYLEEGYSPEMIPSIILENNLVGLDVDKRAIQLTSFALTMKARSYNKNLFHEEYAFPNVTDVKESNGITDKDVDVIARLMSLSSSEKDVLKEVVFRYKDAEYFGSLINNFDYSSDEYQSLYKKMSDKDKMLDPVDIFEHQIINEWYELLCELVKTASVMKDTYDCVVTNPPYQSPNGCGDEMKKYAELYYPNSKADMFAMFIERCAEYTNASGLQGMVTMHGWMFLDSYKDLRYKIINTWYVDSLIHLGARAFEDISGEVVQTCAFVLNKKAHENAAGTYFRLVDSKEALAKEQGYLERNHKYNINQHDFLILPGYAFAYWWSEQMYDCFKGESSMDGIPMKGIQTGKGELYLRFWFEVSNKKIGFDLKSHSEIISTKLKWFPLTSGGNTRRWYGNYWYVVNLENDGADIRSTGLKNFRLKDPKYYFLEGFTWTEVTTKPYACRYLPSNILFGNGGPVCFHNTNLYYSMALMNSAVAREIFTVLAPTINCGPEQVRNFPFIVDENEDIEECAKNNVEIAKRDWDAYETSQDFKRHPLV